MRFFLPLLLCFGFIAISTPSSAQVVTGGLRAEVIDASGKGVAGLPIVITDTSTNKKYTGTTNASGSFIKNFLPTSGSYKIEVDAAAEYVSVKDIVVKAGSTNTVRLIAKSGDVDEVIVTANASNVGLSAVGPKATFTLEDLNRIPAIGGDIKDALATDPRIYIPGTGGREIQCAGGHNRANTLTLDGIANDDTFGLNDNGYPVNRQPFPILMVDQMSMEIAPFDVEYGHFTACNINVLTRSGSNEFKAIVDRKFRPTNYNGDKVGDTAVDKPEKIDNVSAFLSGPIIEDKLFFAFSYEDHEEGVAAITRGPGLLLDTATQSDAITASDVSQVQSIAQSVYGVNAGNVAGSGATETETTYFKLTGFIDDVHRFEASYLDTEGSNPTLQNKGKFTSDDTLSLSSSHYNTDEEMQTLQLKLFSDWSDTLSTEFSYAQRETDKLVAANGQFAETTIATSGGGKIQIGSDRFRHANALTQETENYKAKVSKIMGDHVIKAGYEYDYYDVYNIFVERSLGAVTYDSITDFQNQNASDLEVRLPDSGVANDGAGIWDRELHTMYIQDDWQVNSDLSVILGLRLDRYESSFKPRENPAFVTANGISNSKFIDGLDHLSPRVGLTYTPNSNFTLRAGYGEYTGGDPSVWISNVASNTGFVAKNTNDSTVADFASFDLLNLPTAVVDSAKTAASAGGGSIDAIAADYELPYIKRLSVGGQYEWEGYTLTADYLITESINPNIVIPTDLTATGSLVANPTGTAPDGSPIYGGETSEYFLLKNSDKEPRGSQIALNLKKDWSWGENDFSASIGMANTKMNVVSALTSSRHVSNFRGNVHTDPLDPALGQAPYSRDKRETLSFSWTRNFFPDLPTQVSFFAQQNSGKHYNYTFSTANNIFGTLEAKRDAHLLYIPATINCSSLAADSVVTFANASTCDSFKSFVDANNLSQYAGSNVPRGAGEDPDSTRIDMRIKQYLPVPSPTYYGKLAVVFDVYNLANFLDEDRGLVKTFSHNNNGNLDVITATISGNKFSYDSFNSKSSTISSDESTYKLALSIRYEF